MRPDRCRAGAPCLAAGVVVLLGGCSLTGGFTAHPASTTVVPERPPPEIAVISPMLEMMSALPQGDPAHQAEVFQSAKDAAELSPTTSNRLKYALALATPGHSGSDPVAAQRQLAELLATPQTLQPVERLLAVIELRQVDQRLVLQAENTAAARRRSRVTTRDKLQRSIAASRRSPMKTRIAQGVGGGPGEARRGHAHRALDKRPRRSAPRKP